MALKPTSVSTNSVHIGLKTHLFQLYGQQHLLGGYKISTWFYNQNKYISTEQEGFSVAVGKIVPKTLKILQQRGLMETRNLCKRGASSPFANIHCYASEELNSKWQNVFSSHVHLNWIAVCFHFWQCLKNIACAVFKWKPVWLQRETPLTEGVRVNFWTGATSSGASSWGVLRGTLERGQGAAMMLTQADRQLHELQDSRRGEEGKGSRGTPCPPSHSCSGEN